MDVSVKEIQSCGVHYGDDVKDGDGRGCQIEIIFAKVQCTAC